MLRKLSLILVSFLLTMSYGFSQTGLGTIKGVVKDADSKEIIPSTTIFVFQNGVRKGAAKTDFDGKFQINSLTPGTYDVEVKNMVEGYKVTKLTGVIVSSNKITFLDKLTLQKPKDILNIEEVTVIAYKVPLINKDGGASGATVTREDIARLPVRSASGVAGTVGGVNADEGSGDLSVRGSRSDATYFYIDGIKVRGSSSLPKSAIEEVTVITGGLPANYGDATGGIISVTTRGPSAKYFGSAEVVTSGFYFNGADPDGYDGKVFGLDKYAYNLVEGMFSGPLWMQKDSTGKKTKPRLGFLVSANLTDRLDSRPLAGGSWRIKKDVRDELLENPLRQASQGFGTFHNANFLRQEDFEKTPWRMNVRNTNISAQGKIDVNTGPSVNLTFGGSMNYQQGSNYSYAGSLFNFQNYGAFKELDWRVYGRLTQRFTNNEEGSSSKIKSAYYNIMVDYSKSKRDDFDPKHQYNVFNYGHVGTFEVERERTFEVTDPNQPWVVEQTAIPGAVNVNFTPSSTNPALAAITEQYYALNAGWEGSSIPVNPFNDLLTIQQGGGLLNGMFPQSVYDIWSNIGSPYNYFGKTENDQFRVTGAGSVNIGDHSISLGFEYEQRWDRGWTSGTRTNGNRNGPAGLWTIGRQYLNSHISELDENDVRPYYEGTFLHLSKDFLNTGYASTSGTGNFGGAQQNDNQFSFDYNVRQALGLDPAANDWIEIDALDPNLLSLEMFSPDELLNQGNSYVSYWGFDHVGNKISGTTDINKYFNEFDENGNYKRTVGAFQPIYMAGYVMDKFAFNDIVFNVGLRVDVFDANQPVLKDPYLFYNARTASEAKAELANDPTLTWVNIPDAIGDDYVVYVNDVNNPNAINGFRNGDTWYDANGIEVDDPASIQGSGGIAPWLLDPTKETIDASAFEDYKAQINVMPRIAFSFPISDEASFFAHYDILTKRPTSGFRFDPFQYQFVNERSAIINNANLKPETTIDYELGFQQVLSRTSSLKISAFYREQRNNVQLQNIFEAYPATYRTYGNRDFGTVKGMTIAYDLRRTGNIRMTANYTLQFADGTGSDATSASGLINAGLPNLRAIFPYSFDQRHTFAITMDYRYGSGKDYNGPMIKDFALFENTGLNIVSNIYSGSPYSSQTAITNQGQFTPLSAGLDGTTNGSRLPWSYRLDLQLDRTFDLKFGKGDKKKATFLNVYVRVTNLLNQFNLLNVYRATGNWDDDGFLAAAASQTSIQNQLDEQAFRDFYTMKIQNPFNISAPRTIRLGVKFDF
ncbi:MAG: TonB-dependent receptor plug domain-containing protein [Crocinitomicaceae bacterium]|nr:TonB-dependent receptor plug domain-containing protein [Crocinitomicaceae bacterium]